MGDAAAIYSAATADQPELRARKSSQTETTLGSDIEEGKTPSLTESAGGDNGYVAYVRPKQATVLPPAKYKLWILVFICVYFAGKSSLTSSFCHQPS